MSSIKKFSIQLVIFVALVVAVELAARLIEPRIQGPSVAALRLVVQPYMMFTAPNVDGRPWTNVVKNEPVPSTMKFNNFGFAEAFDFSLAPDPDYLKQHRKRAGEKLVLFTGGSAAAGHGATANDKTIASRMEFHLNEHSGGTRYRVINLGMGSWISYQQFIGLSLFGLPLDPDWVVVMDGANDAQIACPLGSGAAYPMEWAKFLYLTQYGGNERSLPEILLRHSALLRLATGQKPSPPLPQRLVLDPGEADRRFDIKMAGLTMAEEDRQIEFYLQSQRNVLELFHRANVLFSTQPQLYDNAVANSYRAAFRPGAADEIRVKLKAELDAYMAQSGNAPCGSQANSYPLGYFMGRSSLHLMEMAARMQAEESSRHVVYYNTEPALPLELKQREPYFLDNVHMSDHGQDRLGAFYAQAILSAERGTAFDLSTFTKGE